MTTTNTVQPQVWIACLAAYNNGRLHGRWVPITGDPDDLHDAIKQVMQSSPIPGAEEWAFHDFEHVPRPLVDEWADIEKLCEFVVNLEQADDQDAFFAYCEHCEDDPTGERFSDRFRGRWDSERDFALERVGELGIGGIPGGANLVVVHAEHPFPAFDQRGENLIGNLMPYLDTDAVTQTMMDGFSTARVNGDVIVWEDEA